MNYISQSIDSLGRESNPKSVISELSSDDQSNISSIHSINKKIFIKKFRGKKKRKKMKRKFPSESLSN